MWLVILEEALEQHSPCEKKFFVGQEMRAHAGRRKEIRSIKMQNK
jgi:hypothetical protein